MSQKGDPGYKATSVLLGESGWRSRWTVTGCRTCTVCSPGRGDGRCPAGPIPRCGSEIGDLPIELIGPRRTPVGQDQLD